MDNQNKCVNPTKHNSDSSLEYLPSIDDFLNDAFSYSMNELENPSKKDFIDQFHDYISSLHCSESLQFLMAVFHYEYNYNRIYNTSPKLNPRRNSIGTVHSITTNDNFPTNYFASTIDDLDSELNEDRDCWAALMEKQISQSSQSEDDSDDDQCSITDSFHGPLSNQWQALLERFIAPNSKYQVNLSNCTTKALLSIKEKHPDPSVLLPAKKEIYQLLNENVFMKFIKQYKLCKKQEACDSCDCGLKDDLENLTLKEMCNAVPNVQPKENASPVDTKKSFFKKSPMVSPFKFSRPSSPLSINSLSPRLTPTGSASQSFNIPTSAQSLNKKKTKSYSLLSSSESKMSSHQSSSISTLLGHLKLGTKSSSSNSPRSSQNSSLVNSYASSPTTEDKRFKLNKRHKV